MRSIPHLLAATAALAFLSACGGGGGDSTPAPTVTAVAITSSNQAKVARATVDGGLALTQSQGLQATDRATALSVKASPSPARIGAIETAIRRALGSMFVQRRTMASADARPAVASSTTDSCDASGSVTVTVDDRDNSGTISSGDTLALAFAQCKDSADDLLDGTMVITMSNVASSTSTRLEFTGSLAFQQVSVDLGQTSASINGSVTLSALETSASLQMSLSVGSGGLTVSASWPTFSDTIVYEAGMQIATTETMTSPSTMTVALDGALTAASIGGRVTVTTPQAFAQLESAAYPHAGQVLVTGASGSKLRITVIDITQLQLELDADGNGAYEATTIVPWSTLLPA